MKRILFFAMLALLLPISTMLTGCFGGRTHDIILQQIDNVYIYCDVTEAKKGEEITLYYEDLETGYEFNYFVLNGKKIYGGTFTMPDKDVTVSAVISKIQYTITYHMGTDGQATNNNPTAYDETSGTITLNNAIKQDYEFKGWYDNANFTGNKITSIPAGSTGNLNLYAKFVCTKVQNGYRLITNEIDFVDIMSNEENWSGSFKLTANLNLSTIDAFNFEIGTGINNAFTGIFDGNNKTISNITFENSSSMAVSNMKKYAGLFNYVNNATLKNINYSCNINVRTGRGSGDVYVGGLIGFANGNTQITNCHIKNSSITYNANAGWLYVGSITGCGGKLTDCTAENINFDIISNCTTIVGGLVGQLGILENCRFENTSSNYFRVKTMENGQFTGLDYVVGGLVGINDVGGYNIVNCYVNLLCSINVTNSATNGNLYLGGLVGISKEGVTNSYSYVKTASLNAYVDNSSTNKYVNEIVGYTKVSAN